MRPQTKQVLDYLMSGQSLTWLKAFREFKIACVSSRVSDIRRLGYKVEAVPIKTKTRGGGKWVRRYSMPRQAYLKNS